MARNVVVLQRKAYGVPGYICIFVLLQEDPYKYNAFLGTHRKK